MKKLLLEYFNIIAYTITGLIFGFSFFLLFINFYHYRDVNTIYIKQDSDKKAEQELNKKIEAIKTNASSFDINSYKGKEDSYSLASVKSRLTLCVQSIDTETFKNILSKEKLTIKDIYDMQQFHQSQIANECLIKQLYELTLTDNPKVNITTLKPITSFLEDNINQLTKSTDYVQKVIKNNSSYMFNSEIAKTDLYEQTKDSYYTLLNNYILSIDFIYDVSEWYKNTVGGV